MIKKRNLWILIGTVILSAALISGFVLTQPTAETILVQMLENDQMVTDGHAVVKFDVNSIEKDTSGTLEIWAVPGEKGNTEKNHGAFRVEVLEATDEKAQGAVIVSDGTTLWAYSPSENKVFVGTPEEARAMMESGDFMPGDFGQFLDNKDGMPEGSDFEHPENAQEAIEKLQEYVNINKSGTETVAGENAYILKLDPIVEQMPSQYAAVGGTINLWVGKDNHLPLAASYTGGLIGEANFSVLSFEINAGVDESLFTFEVPADAEEISFADIKPESLTLNAAGEVASFDLLTLAETPAGATLVDVLEKQGAIVQLYTLPESGYFAIAQGKSGDFLDQDGVPGVEGQSVELRNTTGLLFESEAGDKVMLTWTEGDLFFSIAGDLTSEQALNIAEALQ